jgi:hypothetical protein
MKSEKIQLVNSLSFWQRVYMVRCRREEKGWRTQKTRVLNDLRKPFRMQRRPRLRFNIDARKAKAAGIDFDDVFF